MKKVYSECSIEKKKDQNSYTNVIKDLEDKLYYSERALKKAKIQISSLSLENFTNELSLALMMKYQEEYLNILSIS